MSLIWTLVFSALSIILNVISYFLRLVFHRKADVKPHQYAVLITGCDSGFGEMTAVRLSNLGYHVVAACLTEDGVKRMTNIADLALQCDITDEKQVLAMKDGVMGLLQSKNIKLWGLINNAGIATSRPVDWMTMELYRKIMVYSISCS
jgi:NAD(P)-dependent dehydrogenase (short-subunit alcohol dehydrogenase family)